MKKSELIKYLNENTKGKTAGRKEIKANDIFISSSNDDKNFRLTTFGCKIVEKYFKMYKIPLTSKQETGNQILAIDTYITTPYYMKNGVVMVFEESIAAELMLLGGDLDIWVEKKKFYE